jgi:KDO2-lipid IV(A) lauroyltransferase
MKRIGYWAFRLIIWLFSLIPFWALYLFSDFLAFLFYHVIRYRKSMILKNLSSCFPEMNDKEIHKICKESYQNLSDILVEALKGFYLSDQEIARRYTFDTNEKLEEYRLQGTSVIGVTAHLTNWEWGAYASGILLKHKIIGVYKKLSQPYINAFMIKSRSKFNVNLAEMKETADMLEDAKNKEPFLLLLIADQRPSNPQKAYWTDFLGRDTAFFYGAEKFAKQYNLPVFFFNITRVKRGFYKVLIEEICPKPLEVGNGGVIETYKTVLQREVLNRPADWLWSHSRWKHAKPAELITPA